MNNKPFIEKLYQELPGLEKAGILSGETAAKIKAHYGLLPSGGKNQVALTVLAGAGAVCIGLGVILLFAYNWDLFSRAQKTAVSFLPLLAAQIITVLLARRKNISTAARESAGAFHFLAVGACIALISQVYHLPGDFGVFLLSWMLLCLPLVYIPGSSLAALFYLLGITQWAAYEQGTGGHALWFWPLAAGLLPFFRKYFQPGMSVSLRGIWLFWVMSLCLTAALGISLEKNIPGLWIVIYAAFFSALYSAGVLLSEEDSPAAWQRPLRTFGTLALLLLAYILTFQMAWDRADLQHYRFRGDYHAAGQLADMVLLTLFTGLAVLGLKRVLEKKKYLQASLAALPLLALFCFALYSLNVMPLFPSLCFNGYLLGFSLYCLNEGLRGKSLGTVNGGMLILGVLILTRFMDASMGILPRAAAFILLGAIFLGVNRVLGRKFYGEENV